MNQSNCAILVAIEPWKPFNINSPIYSEGVKIQVLPASVKRSAPEAKHNGWIHKRKEIMSNLPNEIYESLLVDTTDKGLVVLESLGCNFIGLRKDGTLIFPKDKLLIGIARAILLSAVEGKFNVVYESPTLEEVMNMDECYLCSASRGPFPIIKIDDKEIGDGKPGKTFSILFELYHNQLENELIPI